MSTLQHTSELRVRATRKMILMAVIAVVALAGAVAAIVAVTDNGGSAPGAATPFRGVHTSATLPRDLSAVKGVRPAASTAQPSGGPQVPGHRP